MSERDLQGLRQGRNRSAADDDEVVTQSEQRTQQRAGVWRRGKPHRALALRLGADHVQFQQRLTDAVLDAVERAKLKTHFQAGHELAQGMGQAIEHTRRRFDGQAIGARRERARTKW